jgi:hypothetical protein
MRLVKVDMHEFFKMHFTVSRPQKKIKAQPDGEAASPTAYACI